MNTTRIYNPDRKQIEKSKQAYTASTKVTPLLIAMLEDSNELLRKIGARPLLVPTLHTKKGAKAC